MKIRGSIFFSIIVLGVFVAATYFPKVDATDKEKVILQTLVTRLNKYHYNPQKINDDFSEKVFDYYLDNIDNARRWLTQDDVNKLRLFRSEIDDEILNGQLDFFDLSLEILEKGITKTQQYYQEVLSQPFDFTKDEKIELDGKKRGFAKNDEALKEYWNHYMKYQVMIRLEQKLEDQKKLREDEEAKSYEALEKEARDKVLEIYNDWFARMKKTKRANRLSNYLNSITGIYDPHTTYFTPVAKKEFDLQISGQYEGIGARLQEDGDYTKVTEVMVGGPAWKGKELEANDKILKVGQGDEEPKDVVGMSSSDVVQYIRGKKGTEVRLTVEKVDGTVQVVSIIRDVIVLEERFAKSLIIDVPNSNETIGLISLPSFYGGFSNSRNGRSCSEDVKAEIKKLKKENVDGIILDLRNNPGGLLDEVVKMSGFFIEEGPIVQIKQKSRAPEVRGDKDKSVIWEGPLAIMVNSFSASASEILAAALQDYKRAVVVGSKSTYGKGSVQIPIDLDRTIAGLDDLKPLGQVKTTIQKYYRVDGGSVQLEGVVPDIVLPDNYYFIETGEKDQKYPLGHTKIDPVDYNQNVYLIDNLEALKSSSSARISNNEIFQKILDNAQRLKDQSELSNMSLNLEDFQAYTLDVEERSKKFDELFKEPFNKGIRNLKADLEKIDGDEKSKARNEDWQKTLSKDVYLSETLNILHDMIISH